MTTKKAIEIKKAYRPLLAIPEERLKNIAIAPQEKRHFDEFVVLYKGMGLHEAERFFYNKVKKFEIYLIKEDGRFISLPQFLLLQEKKHSRSTLPLSS